MSCENCGSCSTENGTPKGCGDKGHCSTGGCNRLNTFDWLSDLEQPESSHLDIVEVGFKNNARKEFFRRPVHLHLSLGDSVLVESSGGFDLGQVSLTGELVRLQMKKKRVRENAVLPALLRAANERDLERLKEVRALEKDTLVQARAIARQLNLDMKVGDVEYQGDGRKITFYYTAEGRVDFRELIRLYAKEFKVKIEMRQIGARQESARLGGIGTCGRELCCSTWLADFKSVSTVAARYQNLAINQSKLSGQCGRLKCCLNYELKTYLDALRDFPRNVDRLDTERGMAVMVKMDIFKKIMYFGYKQPFGVTDIQPLPVAHVRLLQQMHREGRKPFALNQPTSEDAPIDFAQVINGEAREERRSRHREQGQNLHKQIADNEQVQEDEAIVLPALNERRRNKKKPTDKPRGPKPRPNEKTAETAENAQNVADSSVVSNAETNPNSNGEAKPKPNPNQQNRSQKPNNRPNPRQPRNNQGDNKEIKDNQEQKAVENSNDPADTKPTEPKNQQPKQQRQERPPRREQKTGENTNGEPKQRQEPRQRPPRREQNNNNGEQNNNNSNNNPPANPNQNPNQNNQRRHPNQKPPRNPQNNQNNAKTDNPPPPPAE